MDRHPTDCIFGDEFKNIPQEMRIMFGTLVLARKLEELMDEFNLRDRMTKQERHMMVNLGVPRRMGQMAEDLNTLPSTVTAVADMLEAKGLVIRERDPADRRAWQLRLTPQGEEARKELIETTVAMFHEITGLSAEEVQTVASAFDKVTANILKDGFPKGMKL